MLTYRGPKKLLYLKVEVYQLFTAKSSAFWDVTPCNPVKVNRLLEKTFRPRFRPRSWRQRISPKRRLTFTGLHSVYCLKIQLFMHTAVKTANPIHLTLITLKCRTMILSVVLIFFFFFLVVPTRGSVLPFRSIKLILLSFLIRTVGRTPWTSD
jgi:hypothetical protein